MWYKGCMGNSWNGREMHKNVIKCSRKLNCLVVFSCVPVGFRGDWPYYTVGHLTSKKSCCVESCCLFFFVNSSDKKWILFCQNSAGRRLLASARARPLCFTNQWIAQDIPSLSSQSERAKMDIHWYGILVYANLACDIHWFAKHNARVRK